MSDKLWQGALVRLRMAQANMPVLDRGYCTEYPPTSTPPSNTRHLAVQAEVNPIKGESGKYDV